MFAEDVTAGGLRIRFSASLPLLDRAVNATVAFCKRRHASGSLFEIKLLLREALLNAVLHGSRSDPLCLVTVEVATEDGLVRLAVEDQGAGFDWRRQMTEAPSPTATSGRGLSILALYADALDYNEAGNRLELVKAIPGIRGPESVSGRDGSERLLGRTTMEDVRVEDGRTVFCPSGDIVASIAESLRARLREVMHEHPGPLAIDLAQVELIDSVGIGLLIAAHNSLAKSGGRLVLQHVNPDLAGLLRTMRLDKHFTIESA